MNVDAMSSASTALAQADLGAQVAVKVAKMAMDTASDAMMTLIQEGLGQNVDLQA